MLWVDKYRPNTLDKMTTVNTDLAQHLKRLVKDGDCPHLLFYGAVRPCVSRRSDRI